MSAAINALNVVSTYAQFLNPIQSESHDTKQRVITRLNESHVHPSTIDFIMTPPLRAKRKLSYIQGIL